MLQASRAGRVAVPLPGAVGHPAVVEDRPVAAVVAAVAGAAVEVAAVVGEQV